MVRGEEPARGERPVASTASAGDRRLPAALDRIRTRMGGGFCCWAPPGPRFPILLPGSVRTVLKAL